MYLIKYKKLLNNPEIELFGFCIVDEEYWDNFERIINRIEYPFEYYFDYERNISYQYKRPGSLLFEYEESWIPEDVANYVKLYFDLNRNNYRSFGEVGLLDKILKRNGETDFEYLEDNNINLKG